MGPIPGSLEAIARLNQAGYRVVVATNQSGIGRGLFDMDTLNAMHEKMIKAAAAGRRPHRRGVLLPAHRADNCECRKPKPGMFERDRRALRRRSRAACRRSATRCATCRRRVAVGCPADPGADRQGQKRPVDDPALPAGTRSSPILPRPSRHAASRHDLPALCPVHAGAGCADAAFRHASLLSLFWLPALQRRRFVMVLGALGRLADEASARHRLPRDRPREHSRAALRDPVQAPVGVGNDRAAGDLSAGRRSSTSASCTGCRSSAGGCG